MLLAKAFLIFVVSLDDSVTLSCEKFNVASLTFSEIFKNSSLSSAFSFFIFPTYSFRSIAFESID